MGPSTTQPTVWQRLTQSQKEQFGEALLHYKMRSGRVGRYEPDVQPKGALDSTGRWYPHPETEKRPCCASIRSPSPGNPYSLLKHCRTLHHIAHLYSINITLWRRHLYEIRQGYVESSVQELYFNEVIAARFARQRGLTLYYLGYDGACRISASRDEMEELNHMQHRLLRDRSSWWRSQRALNDEHARAMELQPSPEAAPAYRRLA